MDVPGLGPAGKHLVSLPPGGPIRLRSQRWTAPHWRNRYKLGYLDVVAHIVERPGVFHLNSEAFYSDPRSPTSPETRR